jgi:hypothetical protein
MFHTPRRPDAAAHAALTFSTGETQSGSLMQDPAFMRVHRCNVVGVSERQVRVA